MNKRLFAMDLPQMECVEFSAEGFSKPVAGVIHRRTSRSVCGMPLGGVGTGCMDLETAGTFGYSTIFNSHVPRRGPLNMPFLGISVAGKTCVLTTQQTRRPEGKFQHGANVEYTNYPVEGPPLQIEGVETARDIHYWGHYPIADMEYEIDSPLSVGTRAWAPFVPGDSAISNTPGAIFEVHVRNDGAAAQQATLAFSFSGPTYAEALSSKFTHEQVSGDFNGVAVGTLVKPNDDWKNPATYVLGVIGEQVSRMGGELGTWGQAWQNIHTHLPEAHRGETGASLAVDLSLSPNEEKVVRFVLAWHSPKWNGGGKPGAGMNNYTHMYTTRFKNALEVAQFLAREHQNILPRIIAWQQEVYSEAALPLWLRESLVNILHNISETGFWAVAEPPIGDWCPKETGLFGMNEDPRGCPQMECAPCGHFGNIPLVYFFPDLALSELRGFRAYQQPDGQIAWVWGGHYNGGFIELAMPQKERRYRPQTSIVGPAYASMVNRLWLCSGDDEILKEFYPSIRQSVIFTMNLCKDKGPEGIISIPDGTDEWYELFINWKGIVTHVAGLLLTYLRTVERMAQSIGDTTFAEQCGEWFRRGSEIMEEQMWADDCYLLFKDPATGEKSDVILGYQLDGEFLARSEDLPGVFRPDRVKTTLSTVKRAAVTDVGGIMFINRDGTPVRDNYHDDTGEGSWGYSVMTPSSWMLGMTYMYSGELDFGLEVARRTVANITAKGQTWSQPNAYLADNGERVFGMDYYQNLMLWAMPAAMANEPLHGPCKPGGLVARVIRAEG